MRVLVVEDELKLARIIQRGMARHGLSADVAVTGEDAVQLARATAYDVIVLDVLLPDLDGLRVCRHLRATGIRTPILMLTALDSIADRVAGLDGGADDYLPKPFAFEELMARVRALARRPGATHEPVLRVGDLRLDPAARTVSRADIPIVLTVKEFALLQTLMRRAGQPVSRFALLESAWDEAYENRSNVIDVYIRYLREKVDRPFGVASIETVRGIGYRISTGGRP